MPRLFLEDWIWHETKTGFSGFGGCSERSEPLRAARRGPRGASEIASQLDLGGNIVVADTVFGKASTGNQLAQIMSADGFAPASGRADATQGSRSTAITPARCRLGLKHSG
jgi:hypothetical protein